jgi:saccharopine dehydrogenase-like NADP-dependent oxidoreductase
MKRVIVLGGLGHFGLTAADQLRSRGIPVQVASRSTAADLQIDANNPDSIRSVLRVDDLIIDAAGPFHARSTALLESAIEIGFDVIDINDDLQYAEEFASSARPAPCRPSPPQSYSKAASSDPAH